jgi:redox-sensitive bicupin YhaK (pirin superfamily)
MLTYRPSEARGSADFGWLKAKHTFSFSEYFDPKFMGFRSLRVINEDRIAAGEGFPTHAHKDMEIITYIISGALEHKDSMGNGSIITPGEFQYMSAGKGVTHSEYNHLQNDSTHLLQIWIMPNEKSAQPRYDQQNWSKAETKNKLFLAVSGEKDQGQIKVRQDAKIYVSHLDKDKSLGYTTAVHRGLWIQLVKGELNVNGQTMKDGDGLAIEKVTDIELLAQNNSEFLLFDLA